MATLRLNEDFLQRLVAARAVPSTARIANEIAKRVRAQNIKVSSSGGGEDKQDLPVRVYVNEEPGRDLVNYTTKAGVTRTATRAQALAWGGSFTERGDAGQYPGTRVVLAHPAGKAVQAKYGVLTRAAASMGFEVSS